MTKKCKNTIVITSIILSFLALYIPRSFADRAIVSVETLNVRSGPGLNYEITGQVHHQERLTIMEEKENWLKIKSDDAEGWVAEWMVTRTESEPESRTKMESLKTVEVTGETLRIRSGPGTDFDVIGHADQGEIYPYLATNTDWVQIQLNEDQTGWVHSDYIVIKDRRSKEGATENQHIGQITANMEVISVRDQHSFNGKIIGEIYENEQYPVYKEEKSWYQIQLPSGELGWVAKWLVAFAESYNGGSDTVTLLYNDTHFRNGPSTDYPITGKGQKGNTFEMVNKHENWYEIRTDSGHAFVPEWAVSLEKNPVDSLGVRHNHLKNKIIIIDAGHGGRDTGAVSAAGDYEKNITIKTSLDLARKLELLGAVPILTRTSDTYLSLGSRVAIAYTQQADAFLSIHYNNAPDYPEANGISTFYYHPRDRELATILHREMMNATQLNDRNVKFGNYHVIRENRRPSVLLELGFVSNPKEEQLIKTRRYQEIVTRAIVRGLNDYFANE